MNFRLPTLAVFFVLLSVLFCSSDSIAQSVALPEGPKSLQPGKEYELNLEVDQDIAGIVQAQLVDADWKKVADVWDKVESGKQSKTLKFKVPADAAKGSGYFWQIILYDSKWAKQTESIVKGVTIDDAATASPATTENGTKKMQSPPKKKPVADPDWTPEGDWELDWQDEFDGTGTPEAWHPFLGYTPVEYAEKTEKGLRWNGKDEDSAQMYSAKTGQHWLNGNGQLVLQISADKTKSNANGAKVSAAYLMTGYPEKWDKSEPSGVKWAGKFFSPAESPRYICARIRTDQLKGHSTWFAFWLFSKTRSYNGNPKDGTEVDIVEIPKGKKDYINKAFNVANHWAREGKGSESAQLNGASDPKSTDLVDVNDDQFHTYGVEWTKTSMKCYVDGKLFRTFTENIPSEPVDMMILLTLEYQENAWDPDQGDGRSEGPFVQDDSKKRVMSEVLVDYVRSYSKKQPNK